MTAETNLDPRVETCERCGNGNFLCEHCCAAHGTSETYSFDIHGSVPEASKDAVADALYERFGRREAELIHAMLSRRFHIAERVAGGGSCV